MATPIREALWLVKHNIPFDVAFRLDDIKRAAFCIVFSEMEGRTFDWDAMKFLEE